MVTLYWDIGQIILARQGEEGWGAKVIAVCAPFNAGEVATTVTPTSGVPVALSLMTPVMAPVDALCAHTVPSC